MENNSLVVQDHAGFLAPVVSIQQALLAFQAKKELIENILVENVDYGNVPGTDKPSLKKAGAEKVSSFFGLHPVMADDEVVEDWTGENHGGEPFLYYRRTCNMYRNGILIAAMSGLCNSWEKKYRYRQANRICPACGQEAIIKGKEEYGGGWLCFAKKGGCGAKYPAGSVEIESQETGQIKNQDVADIANTILKMADKRALVASVLVSTGMSEYFTQDVEDYIDGTFEREDSEKTTEKKPTEHKKSEPAKSNKPVVKETPPQADRPYSPQALCDRLIVMADSFAGKTCTEGDRTSVKLNMITMVGGEQQYHELLMFLVGESHIADVSDAMILALKKWIHVVKQADETWVPDAFSITEAKAAYLEAVNQQSPLL